MPWKVFPENKPILRLQAEARWHEGQQKVACHDSEDKAKAQLAALNAKEPTMNDMIRQGPQRRGGG